MHIVCTSAYKFIYDLSCYLYDKGYDILLEKWKEGQKGVHCVFVDLEKAYDRVPREELWECLCLAKASECYVRVVMDMYDGARTAVRSSAGLTEEFEVGVGLRQVSALSPFLFAIVMDKLTEEIRTESPWDMIFADDIVLCREDRRQLQEVLEVCRNALEKIGLKASRSKTEYMQAGGVDDGGEMRLQGEMVKNSGDLQAKSS